MTKKFVKRYDISFFILAVVSGVLLNSIIRKLHQQRVCIKNIGCFDVLLAGCAHVSLLVEVALAVKGVDENPKAYVKFPAFKQLWSFY